MKADKALSAHALLAASARRRMGSAAILTATSAATMAALGTFAAAALSPAFSGLAKEKLYVRRAFEGSAAAMVLFVAISGWFLTEHYLSSRRRELALWLLAGMRRRTALAELAAELGAALLAGLGLGLGAGALLSRLFALALGALVKTGSTPELRFGAGTVLACAAAAAIQYLVALARAALDLSRASISELIRSEREPEEAPARKAALALLGAALVAAGYAGACLSRGMLAEKLILPVLAATVAGTFLAFEALVPALADRLRSRAASPSARRLSAATIFAAAQAAFRSRRNARLLALCSVLVGMAASAAGTVMATAARIEVEGTYGQDALFGALLFVGGFLTFVFALAAAALLSSRAASDARGDGERRAALRELGAPRREMRRAVRIQSAFFFGVPGLIGAAHSAAAMAMLRTFSGYPTARWALAAGAGSLAILGAAAALSAARQLES